VATTLVISDLHLGGRTGADVLRKPELRAPLLERLAGVDRLVLLGDVLEFRHGPVGEALERSEPFFRDVAEAMGPDREVVLLAGNHDHQLVVPWLERRARGRRPANLGLEQRIAPARASYAAGRIARWLGEERTAFAYPGLWLRDDVYATHGHLADLYSTIPTFERIGAAITSRVVGGAVPEHAAVEDFLARLEPVYAWVDAVARHAPGGRAAGGAGSAARSYELLAGSGPRPLRIRIMAGLFPLLITGLNRAGLGPLSADLGGEELRRSWLRAMGEVVRRLEIGAAHVIFGHSHRAGPLPTDDVHDWATPTGTRLHNAGCWVFESHFLSGSHSDSPYWPGAAVRLEDGEAPVLERLLTDLDVAQLA
jgi:calcineurin-like phosphoesterase family protein